MATIIYKADGLVDIGSTDTTITGYYPSGEGPPATLNFHNGTGRTTLPANRNPHIGDHDDVAVDISDTPLRVGDTVLFHTAATEGETYEAVIDFINGSTDFDAIIEDVLDPFTVENNHTGASITTNTITFDFDGATIGTLPTSDLTDEEIVSFAVVDVATGDVLFIRQDSDDTDFASAGLTGITFDSSTDNFLLAYSDATAANAAADEITGHGGSNFDIIVTWHDGDAITHYSWVKPLAVSNSLFPWTLDDNTVISAGSGTGHLTLQ